MSMTVLEAMAHQEGFYSSDPHVRPRRNNNPLDLEWGAEAKHFGATGGDPRFAVFSTKFDGWDAARRWLSVPAKFDMDGNLVGGYLGATFEQFIHRFAPPNENDTDGYLDYVCRQTGYTKDTILTAEMLQIPEMTA